MRRSARALDVPETAADEAEDRRYGLSRLIAFSDGVFAIAISLLVISILPYADFGSPFHTEQLFQRLASSNFLFHLFSYVLSFCVIGMNWQRHHRTFRYIVRYDVGLLWLNMALLLFIAFLPFPTDLLGRYGNVSVVAAFYAGVLIMLSLLHLLVWEYASFHYRLIRPTLDQRSIHHIRIRMLIPVPLLLISIGIAFVSPYLAEVSWLAILAVTPLLARRY